LGDRDMQEALEGAPGKFYIQKGPTRVLEKPAELERAAEGLPSTRQTLRKSSKRLPNHPMKKI